MLPCSLNLADAGAGIDGTHAVGTFHGPHAVGTFRGHASRFEAILRGAMLALWLLCTDQASGLQSALSFGLG